MLFVVQLFRASSSLAQGIYFWLSLLFLICRALSLCWSASLVYQESKVIIKVINDVPSEFYYREVRFEFEKSPIIIRVKFSSWNSFRCMRNQRRLRSRALASLLSQSHQSCMWDLGCFRLRNFHVFLSSISIQGLSTIITYVMVIASFNQSLDKFELSSVNCP